MQQYNLLDLLAVVIIVVSVATALWKGLTIELISLAGTVAGFVLAVAFYADAAQYLKGLTKNPRGAEFLAFLAIFLGVMILAALIGFLVDRFLKTLHVKWIDRLLGGAFGLLRGLLVCTVLFLALTAFHIQEKRVAESKVSEFFVTGARVLAALIPEPLTQQFKQGYGLLYDRWILETHEAYDTTRF